ncbi:mCG3700, isoform CRA_b [Mus musculus]|nr:mCG3700, isoform CRA_b [Mus musculus]
MEHGLSL